MALHSLGRITVPTPGTAVQCTINQSSPQARIPCHAIMLQALPGNIGKVYIGLVGLNRNTGAQQLAYLAIPTSNTIPAYSATISYAPGGLNIADFYIDADIANDGVLVTLAAG